MAQVKFYAVASDTTKSDNNGIYFVTGGELYKGSQRFGLGRVTVAESTASIEGAARGDIVVTGAGAGWVFDGTNWQSIGGDVASLQSMWQADISTWTAGLVQSGAGSYITGITQDADGKVTAAASNFATDVLETVGDGSASGSGNGITVSVVTTSGSVTGVEVAAADLNVNSVTASAGSFGDITVTGTASFNATTVEANTLTVSGSAAISTLAVGSTAADFTVGGSTIPDFIDNAIGALASATETSTANGIQVSVTTESGAVTSVQVNAPHISAESGTFENLTVTSTATFSATTVNADTLTVGGVTVSVSEHTETSTANGITVSVTTEGGSVKAVSLDASTFGNVMHFVGVEASTGAVSDPVAGDIVIIGSQPAEGFVAGQEYIYTTTSTWELIGDQNTYAVNAYSSTASVFTGVATVPGALDAAGAAIDDHESRITAIEGSIAAMDASVSSSENSSIQVGVTQVDGVVTGVTADLVWLGADGQPIA